MYWQAAGERISLPKALPSFASSVCARTTARALPWPPAAGISARRQASVFTASVPAPADANTRAGIESASMSAKPPAGGASSGIISATLGNTASSMPIWKSAPNGPAISSRKKRPIERPEIRRTSSPIK